MFTRFLKYPTLYKNDMEKPPIRSEVEVKNENRVNQIQNRQYMLTELSKLKGAKYYTFVEDPKNPNGFELFYRENSFPVARISWSSVLPLMDFPTIDVHSTVDGQRFVGVLESPKDVDSFLAKIADKENDANFVLQNLSEIGKSKWFQFIRDPKNLNSIDVFMQWYRTRLASFSWASSPLWVLLDFPTIDVKIWQNKYEQVLGSKDQVSGYLDILKEQAKFLGIVPWSL